MKIIRNNKQILLLLVLGLILRLVLTIFPGHVDILSIAGWGRWIYQNGPMGFYQNNVWFYSWPTQPPLVNLVYGFAYFLYQQTALLFTNIGLFIALHRLAPTYFLWWFDFVRWFGEAKYLTVDFPIGFIIAIKFIGILADLFISLIIFFVAKKFNPKKAIFVGAIYLFSPFSFYLSAMWGQYDQLSYLFLILSFISILNPKTLLFSPVFFLLSANFKPTSLIFIPIFLWIYLKSKPKFSSVVLGVALSLLSFLISVLPFLNKNLFVFLGSDLFPKIFLKSEFRVSTNAFNFWHILIGNHAFADDQLFLFLPAKFWGLAIFLLLNFLAIKVLKVVNIKTVLKAMFVIGFGGWLFLTNMLERYAFAGVTSGLFLVIFYPRLLKYWLILSFTFWINLYHGFWYPDFLKPLMDILKWEDGFLTRIISVVNIFIFIKMLQYLEIFSINLKRIKLKQGL